jgi:hypothetical protein
MKTGEPIFSKAHSVYFKKAESALQVDNLEQPLLAQDARYVVNWKTVWLLFCLSFPTYISYFTFTFAMKFSMMAHINQGCVISLFTVASVYTAVAFYFAFGETISWSKIVGMIFMMGCVFALVMESSQTYDADQVELIDSNRFFYGVLAIVIALLTPLIFTFSAYKVR